MDFRPYQSAANDYPGISIDAFENAVHFVDENGRPFSGAAAAFRLLFEIGGARKAAWWAYLRVPGVASVSERVYRLVARNRVCFSTLTRWLWGDSLSRPTYTTSADLFLRGLAFVYLIAFASLLLQAPGLYGSSGILPISNLVPHLQAQGVGWARAPSIFFLGTSDAFLSSCCIAGILLAAGAIVRTGSWPIFLCLWGLYLSFVSLGGAFLAFQWDILLLEAGFLAIFLSSPDKILPATSPGPPSRLVAWMYRWLLFRLMFASGVVKLTSGDPAWWGLDALAVHFETQPLPNPVSWFAHNLPGSIHAFSCGVMFVIELAVPFLFFAPRRLRIASAIIIASFQILIAATGNYTFFNLLTLVLCLWLIDDAIWQRLRISRNQGPATSHWPTPVLSTLLCVALILSILHFSRDTFRISRSAPAVVASLENLLSPFRLVNTYGLFQVMTTERPEIIVEGSSDGVEWTAYSFHHKPGDLSRWPSFVAPFQPRLDWQMWFAALSPPRYNPWFYAFCQRLLDGSASVTALLDRNPFPDRPPKFIRARLYTYSFTTWSEKAATGNIWVRQLRGDYLPPIQRRSLVQ